MLLAALLLIIFYAQAQKKNDVPNLSKGDYIFVDLQGDTTRYRDQASLLLRKLKNGSVIVRLKTSAKSVEQYRKAGKEDIAHRIEEERKSQNQQMYYAFRTYFTFCKVFFIYARDTKKCLDGQPVFLNEKLDYDTSITLPNTNFVFCEYGSAESYSRFTDISGFPVSNPSISGGSYEGAGPHKILDTVTRKTSTDPASTSALFFTDKNQEQLHRPFPFSEAVYLNSYNATVNALNREMERAYYRLVVNKDVKDLRKAERKKRKELEKQK